MNSCYNEHNLCKINNSQHQSLPITGPHLLSYWWSEGTILTGDQSLWYLMLSTDYYNNEQLVQQAAGVNIITIMTLLSE